jgi:hypothetical protein
MTRRNRGLSLIAGGVVVALGLASRRYAPALPAFLAAYAGDTLWALMMFVLVGFIVPRWSRLRVGVIALAVSYAVEVSQMYHAPWIDNLRHTRLGGLVLGFGFLWSDLVCYTAGVTLGVVLEVAVSQATAWRRRVAKRPDGTAVEIG